MARHPDGAGPTLRQHKLIPATSATLRLADVDGVEQPMHFDGYRDSVSLGYGATGPVDAEFEYLDEADPRQGDYYFVRVRQTDESLAWTSPVWVGGSPPR